MTVKILQGLGALILVLTTAALGLWGLSSFLRFLFDGVNPTVAAASVAAGVAAIVSVATVVLGRYFERRAQIELALREAQLPIYQELITVLMAMLKQSGDSAVDSLSDEERSAWVVSHMRRLTPQLITWAGDDVLVKWSAYRRQAGDLEWQQSLRRLGELLVAIRKDFGYRNRGVTEADVLGLFINDIDETWPKA